MTDEWTNDFVRADQFLDAQARIEALEARVAAADKLAEWAKEISDRKPSPATGGRIVLERDIVGLETALFAYEAIKEPTDETP